MGRELNKEICCLSKTYNFSSGHRLFLARLNDKENYEVFGKCSNPKGHGHDYYLEVKVRGNIDQETGMVIGLNMLDTVVNQVLRELDYKRLDKEVQFFIENQPTGENIIRYLWDNIKDNIENADLVYLKLIETENNYFEYFEESDRRYAN